MRYFVASTLDLDSRSAIRDLFQNLKKYKRNLEVPNLETIHVNYKYLGQNLNDDTLLDVNQALAHLTKSKHWSPFTLIANKVQVGKKSQLKPTVAYLELENIDNSFLDLTDIIHYTVVNAAGDRIVKFKDNPNLLGKIKLTKIRSNTSIDQQVNITAIIKSLNLPIAIKVDNISVLKAEVIKGKAQYSILNRHQLN